MRGSSISAHFQHPGTCIISFASLFYCTQEMMRVYAWIRVVLVLNLVKIQTTLAKNFEGSSNSTKVFQPGTCIF
jgi:hypothetical protein